MSVVDTRKKIQDLVRAIDGVKSAPYELPDALSTDALPCALTWPGKAAWSLQAAGLKRQDRTYVTRIYVLPVVQGEGINDGCQRCLPLLQNVGAAFLADRTLGSTVELVDAIIDGGYSANMLYRGTMYHGVEFTTVVTEKWT